MSVPAIIVCLLFLSFVVAEDYYDLLGVSKDADNRDIRRAFKKLALKMHPDKNPNDEKAHDEFIKINKVYEVLKDEEMRKKYDLHGEDGLKDDFGQSWRGNYQSWNYYYESFGIYDDDPEVITLSKLDFEQSVTGSPDVWFINFYSPQCTHCHQLAPAWRIMARELEGVVRIGAVNCEEDWSLCRQQNVHSYPSIILYPQKEKYRGSRESDNLIEYILEHLPQKVIHLSDQNLEKKLSQEEFISHPWLVFVCKSMKECIVDDTIMKLSIILDGLVNVCKADIGDDDSICKKINCKSLVTYYDDMHKPIKDRQSEQIDETETKTILNKVLQLLPGTEEITWEKFTEIRETLNSGTSQPWLIEFAEGLDDSDASQNTELKRLRGFLPNVQIGRIDCRKDKSACSSWSIKKFPVFVAFKPGGTYEFHHGRFTAHDIATFVRESLASKVQTLTSEDFPAVTVSENQPWFIDFFAPWCPPCMQLLPEYRKASRNVGHLVKFGSVDCTMHSALCSKYNIKSYPTAVLFSKSVPHTIQGYQGHQLLEEFVEDTLNPIIVSLNLSSFEQFVASKTKDDVWVIDFFAPWCSPCQQLAPQWRKLAKMMKHDESIHIGQVDCTRNSDLCHRENIHSYPSIKLYPKGVAGVSKFHLYSSWNRDAHSFQAWIYSYLPSMVPSLTLNDFRELLSDSEPWMVDFYAPWCGHCQTFAPEFERVAKATEGIIKIGKVNCDEVPNACNAAGINAYPTVVFYAGSQGNKQQDPSGDILHTLTYDSLTNYIERTLGITLNTQSSAHHDEL